MQFILNKLILLPWIISALIVHEFAHAYVSYRLGDPTPKWEGRLSLNPLVHLDPIGFLAMMLFSFGWAKPVMINPRFYPNPMRDTVWVSLAGPGSNFILAIILALILQLINITFGANHFLVWYLIMGILLNIQLGIFNLIPIPPLDGSKVLRYFLNDKIGYYYDLNERYGFIVLIIFLYLGFFEKILDPVMTSVITILTGIR